MHTESNKARILIGSAALAVGLAVSSIAAHADERKSIESPEGHPLSEIISGYEFRKAETQALQDDEFQNPAMLWVDTGAELWDTADGEANKSCADCHGDAGESMAETGAHYPKWNEKKGKAVNLEQRINICRVENQKADPWKWESDQLLGMTAYVRHQAQGVPVEVQTDGPMKAVFEKGKKLYYTRNGQLDMACANCHEDNYGNHIRSDLLSQGQSNGFPTYRLKWQKVGSLHRRFKGCMKQVRAEPYKVGSDEFVALELYLAWRGVGLPVETPAVRN